MQAARAENIDSYIAGFDGEAALRLKAMRETIAKAAPDATEAISYGMPTFRLEGNLVHFAAAKAHIGFYPAPSGIKAFSAELSSYPSSKGAIRFPNGRPLPLELVEAITRFRAAENKAKAASKKR